MAKKGQEKKKKSQRREARKQVVQALIEFSPPTSGIRRHAPETPFVVRKINAHTSPVRPAGEMSRQHLFSGW